MSTEARLKRAIVHESRHGFYHLVKILFEEPHGSTSEYGYSLPVGATKAQVAEILRKCADHIERYTAPETL